MLEYDEKNDRSVVMLGNIWTVEEWQYECANGETLRGFAEWREAKIEMEAGDEYCFNRDEISD